MPGPGGGHGGGGHRGGMGGGPRGGMGGGPRGGMGGGPRGGMGGGPRGGMGMGMGGHMPPPRRRGYGMHHGMGCGRGCLGCLGWVVGSMGLICAVAAGICMLLF